MRGRPCRRKALLIKACAPASAAIPRPKLKHVDSLAAKKLASRHAARFDRQADLLLQIGRVDSRSHGWADSRERSGALVERPRRWKSKLLAALLIGAIFDQSTRRGAMPGMQATPITKLSAGLATVFV